MFDTLDGYRGYLRASFIARYATEAALDAAQAERVFDLWPSRRLAPSMANDLADLAEPKPSCGLRMEHLDDAAVLGRLYVLEGSALGARVMLKWTKKLGLSDRFGARHLYNQSDNIDAWQKFCGILDNAVLSASEEARVIASANATFLAFADAFD